MQSLSDQLIREMSLKIPVEVGQRIIQARKGKSITQSELAELVGKDRQYIYKIEKGKVTISITTLAIIAKALDTNLATLLAGFKL